MDKVTDFLENFLQHEYDPVKAREYYLRTRKLKGRQGGSRRVNPGSKVGYNGKPLKPLGQRIEEDETPKTSPSGAKLVDYDGKGLGKGVYADGTVYEGATGWRMRGEAQSLAAQAKAKPLSSDITRARRHASAQKKLARAQKLAAKVKGPEGERLRKKLSDAQNRLNKARAAANKGR